MSKGVAGTDGDDEPVVHCDAVGREYRRGGSGFLGGGGTAIRAVDDVTLSVDAGEVVGIAGPSGSGKSTLLHLLAGLDTPTEGTVTLAGTDVSTLSERGRARHRLDHVGIVFQRFHLLPSLTATSNVALPLLERGVGKRTRRKRARDALKSVGLGDRADHRPGQLSGGERQRVAIARALITEPDLVVADEPTGELDTETSERVLDELTDLATDRAVIVASHDQQTLDRTRRRLRLRDGRLVHDSHA